MFLVILLLVLAARVLINESLSFVILIERLETDFELGVDIINRIVS